jgi:hypothetical protein
VHIGGLRLLLLIYIHEHHVNGRGVFRLRLRLLQMMAVGICVRLRPEGIEDCLLLRLQICFPIIPQVLLVLLQLRVLFSSGSTASEGRLVAIQASRIARI